MVLVGLGNLTPTCLYRWPEKSEKSEEGILTWSRSFAQILLDFTGAKKTTREIAKEKVTTANSSILFPCWGIRGCSARRGKPIQFPGNMNTFLHIHWVNIGRHSADLWFLCPIAGPSTVLHKTPDRVMNFRMPNPSMACIDPCLYFVKYQNTPPETPVVESDYPLKEQPYQEWIRVTMNEDVFSWWTCVFDLPSDIGGDKEPCVFM